PGFLDDGTTLKDLSPRLYVMAANRGAYKSLLELWKLWMKPGRRLPEDPTQVGNRFDKLRGAGGVIQERDEAARPSVGSDRGRVAGADGRRATPATDRAGRRARAPCAPG